MTGTRPRLSVSVGSASPGSGRGGEEARTCDVKASWRNAEKLPGTLSPVGGREGLFSGFAYGSLSESTSQYSTSIAVMSWVRRESTALPPDLRTVMRIMPSTTPSS